MFDFTPLKPYFLAIKIASLAVGALAIVGVTHHYDAKYYNAKIKKVVAADQKILNAVRESYNTTIEKNTIDAFYKTKSLQDSLDNQTSEYKRIMTDADSKLKSFKDSARVSPDGTGGLWIRTTAECQPSTGLGIQTSSASRVTFGTSRQAYSQLDEKTATDLITITGEGDAAIEQLNKVIDAYNRIQQQGCSPNQDQK